ncbi:MAG: VCBS repeat-containing protein [Planctomycetota bacterium]|nr:VCBS repeat-containing protein [Planctomycetota bacterium]
MSGRRPLCAALAVAALLAPLASGQEGGVGPDGPTPEEVEAFVDGKAAWLAALGDFVDGREVGPLGAGVVFTAPIPSSDEWIESEVAGLLTVRSYGAERAETDADAWRGRFIRGEVFPGECEVKVKTIGARQDAGGMILELRIEVRGVEELGLPPVWQATALSRAFFDADGQCMKLELDSFERSQLDEPYFVERTAGVFAGEPELAELLGVGMDRLATRLDDAALSAWFGHQGIAAGDVNGDGLPDLYVAMPSGVPNLLLIQEESGRVRNVADEHGVAWLDDTKGVLLLDMDGDGDDDVVSALGPVIVVQENAGEGPFPVTGMLRAPDEASFYSIAAARLDGDAVPEIFGTRYVSTRYGDAVPVPFHEARNGPSNHLFQWRGGSWSDITEEAGLAEAGGRFSLSAQFVDATGDGRLDLYVVNDFGSNQLFERVRGASFRAVNSPVCDPGAGMGASWGDVDGDGDLDLHVTNMYSSAGRRLAFQGSFGEGLGEEARRRVRGLASGNALYLSDGEGSFERSEGARIEMGRWGWGGVMSDFDRDGLLDIFVPAGFLTGPEPGDL